ncbi:2-amino-4-hydroxy-6-hydroxymethyldihydropteridine diphosphokinase [Canibacter sp. lx-45]|uniref:2-amino-4-hydroxy-6- hydroxymethyldihydropteridine diphosphokinase n=1 Tax=Canibacter zhuwentaonis TaxID=2837491 RepID=UPI001BDC5D86|nr:2-amino-4-hydroxy-6-hydroxymethyldihydropteridine diphosphokinase [Canibacter zhuwentaonis]MBT1035539.1 2-amino-4-hydroxy-6-hydroxymethyldihydropteridine diphosphokinase [Canibacter zhuwentaonis]
MTVTGGALRAGGQLFPVVLAFGANLGDRARVIRAAQRELVEHTEIVAFRASALIETVKLDFDGVDETAPGYLNGVALAATSLSPVELLRLTQQIESLHGRVRETPWGDRTLDIDIICYGETVLNLPDLTLPHPRAHERDFVLEPWLALDPEAVLPGRGRVAELLDSVKNATVKQGAIGGQDLVSNVIAQQGQVGEEYYANSAPAGQGVHGGEERTGIETARQNASGGQNRVNSAPAGQGARTEEGCHD